MPCTYEPEPYYDPAATTSNALFEARKELDKLTDMLCRTMAVARKDTAIWKQMPADACEWWTSHHAKDKQRIESQIKQAKQDLKSLAGQRDAHEKKIEEKKRKLEQLQKEREEILNRDSNG